MAASKRAVVLRLAELERYPTLKARYEIMLPFPHILFGFFQDNVICNCPKYRPNGWQNFSCQGSCDLYISFVKRKAKAIEQTEKRWIWFSEARKLDDRLGRRLGTLGLLPFEIREMIWRTVIDDYKEKGKYYCDDFCREYNRWEDRECMIEGPWLHLPLHFVIPHEPDTPRPRDSSTRLNIFDLQHYFKSDSVRFRVMDLRLVSPEAKLELENTFISTQAFRFVCPMALDRFLDQLPAHQKSLLRSITLRVFDCNESCLCGEKSMESECRAWVTVIERLPATLQFVTFECGWLDVRPGYRNYETEKDVALLEIMTKKVRRLALRANISMAELDEICGGRPDRFQNMLDEVEPFSEDFMKWSEQTRKAAMD